jgi:ADP-ribose pyrophosphatase
LSAAAQLVVLRCTGLVDAGETVEQTALRELKEETGYVAASIKNVSLRKAYNNY